MLYYKMMKETESEVAYHYFPEGKEKFGIVTMSKETGNVIEVVKSDPEECRWYEFHMVCQLQDFFEIGEYKKDGMIAWY